MRTLVLGAGGMAGHVISLYLRDRGFTVDTLSARHRLDQDTQLIDVTDITRVKSFLDSKQYDLVVNCIALLPKPSEERKDLAASINSYFPLFLERYYQGGTTKIIHISTDGVFSGKNPPYKEDSEYDGQGIYDRSKALGEIINAKDLSIRTSIFGPDMNKTGTGLLNWFFGQKGEISGYDKLLWSGVSTLELAKSIEQAAKQDITGVYHLIPSTSISKLDLLQLFKKTFGRKDISIKPKSDVRFERGLINTRKDLNHILSDYKTMVEEMKDWVDSHKHLYEHYL